MYLFSVDSIHTSLWESNRRHWNEGNKSLNKTSNVGPWIEYHRSTGWIVSLWRVDEGDYSWFIWLGVLVWFPEQPCSNSVGPCGVYGLPCLYRLPSSWVRVVLSAPLPEHYLAPYACIGLVSLYPTHWRPHYSFHQLNNNFFLCHIMTTLFEFEKN